MPPTVQAGTVTSVPALRLSGVSKAFGDLRANDDVGIDFWPCEIHALLGENGAGKSTLMHIVFGSVAPDAGTMEIDGQEGPWLSTREAIESGIGMVHQHFMLVPTLTVAENVLLNVMWTERGRQMSLRDVSGQIAKLGERYDLALDPHALVDGLSVGEKLRLEIGKVLIQGELRGGLRLFILDEPTALLTRQEIERLFMIMRELAANGTAVAIITHKLDEVMEMSDRVTVLRDGRVVGSLPTSQTSPEELGKLMVGRALPERRVTHGEETGEEVLAVRDLSVVDGDQTLVEGVSFTVRSGEILGVAGVAGNGQDVLADCITGLRPATGGEILLHGRAVTNASRRALIEREVAHVPEDRQVNGLVGSAPLRHNFILGLQRWHDFQRRGWLRRRQIAEHGKRLTRELDVRSAGLDQQIDDLSGGNQQRVLLGRELHKQARFLVACGPTRGLDIAGTAYVQSRLIEQRDQGAAILLVSLDLDELLKLSDRVVVMYRGRVVGELDSNEADSSKLGLMMGGATVAASTGARE
jgi:general nucleoside transport system ATP-binding protein